MAKPANPEAVWQALRRLLDAQGDGLYGMLARLTLRREAAGELLQELFLRLGKSEGFARAEDQGAYAFRAAINLAMEWRRKRRGDGATVDLALAGEVETEEKSPLQRMVAREQFEQLLNALSELSEGDQRLFVLRFFEERSYEEIARELETTAHRARGLCHAAVRRLRERAVLKEKSLVEKNHVRTP
jgi:RNA polymerase sigma-70 factor (ECF subfamily)